MTHEATTRRQRPKSRLDWVIHRYACDPRRDDRHSRPRPNRHVTAPSGAVGDGRGGPRAGRPQRRQPRVRLGLDLARTDRGRGTARLRPLLRPQLAAARPEPSHPRGRPALGCRDHRRRRTRLPRRGAAPSDPHRLPRRALPPASGQCPAHRLRHHPGGHDPARGGCLPVRAVGFPVPTRSRLAGRARLLAALRALAPPSRQRCGGREPGARRDDGRPRRLAARGERRRHGPVHRCSAASWPESSAGAAAACSPVSACTGRPTPSASSSASWPGVSSDLL